VLRVARAKLLKQVCWGKCCWRIDLEMLLPIKKKKMKKKIAIYLEGYESEENLLKKSKGFYQNQKCQKISYR